MADISSSTETSSDDGANRAVPRVYANNRRDTSNHFNIPDKRVSRNSDEKHENGSGRGHPQQYSENTSSGRPTLSGKGPKAQQKSLIDIAKAAASAGYKDDESVLNDIGAPLAEAGLNEESILRAFSQIDCDGNSFVGSKDLVTIMRAAELEFTDLDIERMIKAVDQDGDGQINMPEFRKFVYTKLIGVPLEDYNKVPVPPSTEFQVDPSRRVRRVLKDAEPVDTKQLEVVDVKKPSAGEINVVKMTDLEIESKKSRRERILGKYGPPCTNHPKEKIAEMRNIFFSFTQGLQLTLFNLEEAYYKCVHTVRDDLGMVTFQEFCEIYDVAEDNEQNARVMFDCFKCGQGKRAPAHMLAMACLSVLRAPPLKKLNLLFIICDPEQSGQVHKDDVGDMLAAATMSHSMTDYKQKHVVLMGDRNAVYAKKTFFKKNIYTVTSLLFPTPTIEEKDR